MALNYNYNNIKYERMKFHLHVYNWTHVTFKEAISNKTIVEFTYSCLNILSGLYKIWTKFHKKLTALWIYNKQVSYRKPAGKTKTKGSIISSKSTDNIWSDLPLINQTENNCSLLSF